MRRKSGTDKPFVASQMAEYNLPFVSIETLEKNPGFEYTGGQYHTELCRRKDGGSRFIIRRCLDDFRPGRLVEGARDRQVILENEVIMLVIYSRTHHLRGVHSLANYTFFSNDQIALLSPFEALGDLFGRLSYVKMHSSLPTRVYSSKD